MLHTRIPEAAVKWRRPANHDMKDMSGKDATAPVLPGVQEDVDICNPLPSQPDIPVPEGPDGPPPKSEPTPELAPAPGQHLVPLHAAHDPHAIRAGVQDILACQ
jgi:hypothetical protein